MAGLVVWAALLGLFVCRSLGFSLASSAMTRLHADEVARAFAARAEMKMRTGCFFWERGECTTARTMCGSDSVVDTNIKDNPCKKFVFSFNHAYEECAPPIGHPADLGNMTSDNFRNCFFSNLQTHLPAREYCPNTCEHSHEPSNVGGPCFENCLHIHHCVDDCNSDKYPFRDSIETCLQSCADLSPVSGTPTCRESCGTHSPNRKCWCDPTCLYTGDCCSDFANWCQGGLQDAVNHTLPLPNETEKPPPMNVSLTTNYRNPLIKDYTTAKPEEVGIPEEHIEPPNNKTDLSEESNIDPVAAEKAAEEMAGGGYSPAVEIYNPSPDAGGAGEDNMYTPEEVVGSGGGTALLAADRQRLRSRQQRRTGRHFRLKQ